MKGAGEKLNEMLTLTHFELQTILMGGSRILRGMGRIGGPHSPFSTKKLSLGPPCEIFQDPRVISLYIKGSDDHVDVRCVNQCWQSPHSDNVKKTH